MSAEEMGKDLEMENKKMMVQKWAKEREAGEVSFESFKEASEIFGNDYAIVGHGGEPVVNYFEAPRPHGEYTVTGLAGMNEEQFIEELSEQPITLFIACMDKRGAKLSYDEIKEMMVEQGLLDTKLMALLMGGGVIQEDEITQDGQAVEVFRGQALETMLAYIAQNAEVAHVFSTDHDCRCGACAFYNDGQGVPEKLGVERGSDGEQLEMESQIMAHTELHLPNSLIGKTSMHLSHFAGPHDHEEFTEFLPIK